MKEWITSTGDKRRKITSKQFIGYIGNYNIFKDYVLALAERYDYKRRNQIVIISDGADWIHKLVKQLFPDAVHILDLSHMKEHIGDFGKFLHKHDEDKARKWIDHIIEMLEESKTEELIGELSEYKDVKCPQNILNLYTYICNHQDCIDYKSYREKGYFVGSDASESANKYVMKAHEHSQCVHTLLGGSTLIGRPFPGVSVRTLDGKLLVNTSYGVIGLEQEAFIGDCSHFDQDGFLYFDGRQDDICNVDGQKISSSRD